MKRIDTSGMGCPQPVLMTKKAIEESPEGVEIIVDNKVAKGNVERFLNSSGYKMDIREEDDIFIIGAKR